MSSSPKNAKSKGSIDGQSSKGGSSTKLTAATKNTASQQNQQQGMPSESKQQEQHECKEPGKCGRKQKKWSRLVLTSDPNKFNLEEAPKSEHKVNLKPPSIPTSKCRPGTLFSELFGSKSAQKFSSKHNSSKINNNKQSGKEMPSTSKAPLKPPLCRPELSEDFFGDESSSMLKMKTVAPRRCSNIAQNTPLSCEGAVGGWGGSSTTIKASDEIGMEGKEETGFESDKECEMCKVIQAIEETSTNAGNNNNNANNNNYSDNFILGAHGRDPPLPFLSQYDDENILRLEELAMVGVIMLLHNGKPNIQ